MKKRIRLNAVEMANPVQDNAGLWTYPDNRVDRYKDLDYWTELAQLLERGKFDAVFFADILGVYDVYQNSRDTAVREGLYLPINDPTYAVPAMAAVTEHLSFAVTVSLTYEHPYSLARKMSTLDHLTGGRMGWNMVTSNLESAARNYGLDKQIQHDERYDRGDEYLEVCYKLWQASWEEDAVVRDMANKMYTNPAKVHDIRHEGKYFKVPGIHLCEPSPQRTPVLFQAGSSDRGREFAAKHAECIFLNAMTVKETRFLVQDIRERAERNGRNPEDVLFFPKLNPVVAATEEEAQHQLRSFLEHSSTEGALSLLSAWVGMDFSKFGAEELLAFIRKGEERNSSTYLADFFGRNYADQAWSVDELAKYFAFGGVGSLIVGTPVQIADQLEAFVDETGVDGFNIAYITRPGTFESFIDLAVPELQRRERVQSVYEKGTFREKLFGKTSYLAPQHPGSRVTGGRT
ncbi:FMN-dependent oxidoreductase (nitrilotriacetate monooxygenase family) [Paenibacillus eucommiae]|uniref:FMN-dependent oxidoreductase (Nitrilotriacetate monooxygenase family) n=1 Tax=Paenibacillus eucommiae TaxID=1355755 RepID=A0ABS4J927_9BACL|nr:LLM class flavin-dependent oxidoreductase [Paenibacillus eucommiae]MBP1996353.1 FMN-dependent oxidoreductase (nitrilotriacetate monooxygenase family) [Paenibacillus eucommiae]